jgi:hypothetical protein
VTFFRDQEKDVANYSGENKQTNKQKSAPSWAWVAHTCNPSYSEAEIRRTAVQSQPEQIVPDPLSKKPFTTKGWWSGSRCRP